MMGTLQKILHVEDDPDIQEIVKICLEAMGGYELLQCGSGREALDKAAAYAPDLVILDMMMPGMNGIETLQALRKDPALGEVPAVFVTSVNTAEKYKQDIEDLAIGAIQKPFDPMLLAQQVQDLWDRNTT